MDKARVLIVDDDPDVVESIKYNLELENFECIDAYNGEEALVKARVENPDLILLDIMLPRINGYEVCRLLKYYEECEHIPIIMLTSRTQETDKSMGKNIGADEYVCKPFIMDELVKMIRKHVKKNDS